VCVFAMMMPAHTAGGMEYHTLELAKGLVQAGHDVVVLTGRHPEGVESEVVGGVQIHYVDVAATSKRPMGRAALGKFEELHAEKGFDVVHSQSFAAYYLVKDGVKDRLRVPLVTTLHGTYSNSIRSHLNQGLNLTLPLKVLFHIFNHHYWTVGFVQASNAVIAVSDEIAEKTPKEFKIISKKVKTIYNGVDVDVFTPETSSLKEEYGGGKVVLSVSALHRQKGIQYLIEAFERVMGEAEDAQLMVAGDGPYRGELEHLAKEHGVEATFTGHVEYDKLPDYYNLASLYAMPTVAQEGLPLSLLEAMACGKPVVASDTGGIKTAVADGKNGLLVGVKDVDSLAQTMIKVLLDDGLAAKLGENARKTIIKDFSTQKMIEETVKVYEGCVT
jgi:glycosyltransferase involved in cell wall biosynthesis